MFFAVIVYDVNKRTKYEFRVLLAEKVDDSKIFYNDIISGCRKNATAKYHVIKTCRILDFKLGENVIIASSDSKCTECIEINNLFG